MCVCVCYIVAGTLWIHPVVLFVASERERSALAREAEKKTKLMAQLKEGMERARAVSLRTKSPIGHSTCCAVLCLVQLCAEEEQQERDRDMEMMAAMDQHEHESTVRERELKQDARWAGGVIRLSICLFVCVLHAMFGWPRVRRESVEAHYQQLSREAELRTLRAQWRAQRMSLGMQRLQQMEQEAERYQEELRSKPESELARVSKVQPEADSTTAKHIEVLDIESSVTGDGSPSSSDSKSPPPELVSSELHKALESESTSVANPMAPSVSHKVLDDIESSNKAGSTGPVNGLMMRVVKAKEQPCQAKEILYSGTGNAVENHKTSRGFKSDSVMQDILYGGQEVPKSEPTCNSVDRVAKDWEQEPGEANEIVYSGTSDSMGKHEARLGVDPKSVMQKIIYGGYEEPYVAKEAISRTYEPPCQAKEILYGGVDDTVKDYRTNHGFKSDSVMQDILYGSGWGQPRRRFTSTPEEPRLAVPVTTRGLPPSSVVQELLYPDADGREKEEGETNGPSEDENADVGKFVQVRDGCLQAGESKQGSICLSQETSQSSAIPDSPCECELARVS